MSFYKFGFIGAGNMGGALARAVTLTENPQNVVIADNDTVKATTLSDEIKCAVSDSKTVAKSAKYIFLGVKPQVMASVLEEIKPCLESRNDRFVLVTMAAGISVESLCNMAGKDYPVIRIMPNTPVSRGKGMILYTFSENTEKEEADEFCAALEKAGKLDYIDESLIDAASVVSGCGPAFVYMFAEGMALAASELGVDTQKAILYASQTLAGAAELLMTSSKTPETLINEVCSPGGSTIEGVKTFRNNDLYGTISKALNASYKRTKELGK